MSRPPCDARAGCDAFPALTRCVFFMRLHVEQSAPLPQAFLTWSASPFTVQGDSAVCSPLDDALAAIAQLQHVLREEQASSAQLRVKIQQYV